FDTPQNALANARAALRIRDNNGQCEQTLKTRGTSVAGLQQRGEWNWPLTGAALDLTLLQQDEVPPIGRLEYRPANWRKFLLPISTVSAGCGNRITRRSKL